MHIVCVCQQHQSLGNTNAEWLARVLNLTAELGLVGLLVQLLQHGGWGMHVPTAAQTRHCSCGCAQIVSNRAIITRSQVLRCTPPQSLRTVQTCSTACLIAPLVRLKDHSSSGSAVEPFRTVLAPFQLLCLTGYRSATKCFRQVHDLPVVLTVRRLYPVMPAGQVHQTTWPQPLAVVSQYHRRLF